MSFQNSSKNERNWVYLTLFGDRDISAPNEFNTYMEAYKYIYIPDSLNEVLKIKEKYQLGSLVSDKTFQSKKSTPIKKSRAQRLLDKYSGFDFTSLDDEALLTYILSLFYDDPSHIVEKLLDAHGTLFNVINASEASLKNLGLSGTAIFHLNYMYELDKRIKLSAIKTVKDLHLVDNYKRYFADLMYYRPLEEVWLIMFDKFKKPISCQPIGKGLVGQVWLELRSVIYNSSQQEAFFVVLCHNHNLNDVEPSKADLDLTKTAISEFSKLNITLLDHVVVHRGKALSLRYDGFGEVFLSKETPPSPLKLDRLTLPKFF